jgi:chromosome segregation ATPase
MSLAGKILIGVTIFLTLLWVFFAASVANYNSQGSQAVQKLQKQKADLEAQIVDARAKHRSIVDKTLNEQVATGEDVAVLDTKRFAAQKIRSDAVENETRARIDLQGYQAALKNAETDRDNRIAEEKETRAELEKLQGEVKKLIATDDELRAQLAKLVSDFKSLYAANKAKAVRISK